MALIPRKYRNLIYKLLVLIPLIWLTVALLHNNNSNNAPAPSDLDQSGGSGSGVGVGGGQQSGLAARLAAENNVIVPREREFNAVEVDLEKPKKKKRVVPKPPQKKSSANPKQAFQDDK
jgi:hypothetical protein